MKTALICGISGQDGAYLSQLLLGKGYKVIGTSRDTKRSNCNHLEQLGILDEIEILAMAINDFRSVLNVFKKTQPDEVYNLAGQSSVGLSFEQPVETLESINIATLNLLEAIRFLDLDCNYTMQAPANVLVNHQLMNRQMKAPLFCQEVPMLLLKRLPTG